MDTGIAEIADEVADALVSGGAVVALESTLLAHGLPAGRNLEVGRRLERIVREHGAVPATIAVLDGRPVIGLSAAELERVCDPAAGLVKLSRRDLAPARALGRSGATTVAATTALAYSAGVAVFATGGLGGVHRGANETWDVSADMGVLADTPILVVCSGVKSVLDIGATLELLETNSVPVLGYRTDFFPAFYLRESPFGVPWRVQTPAEAAAVFAAHRQSAPGGAGVVLANPVPAEYEMPAALHDRLLADGLALLRANNITGKDVTPALLEHFHANSDGVSLRTNTELVAANTALAAQVAVALSSQPGNQHSGQPGRRRADHQHR
ncbi:MAG TPA: pseudouridine-5'-phosphate glycosidase [Pseudonocardiaceae bacterium]|nr:pseudouridine-5'-phosphate glycosidase [Pseudonocardiaceae bacterium]